MNNKTTNVRYLAQLALLAAIEVVMKLMGLGSVPVGAMTMGPTAGAILGGVFGLVSMKDAITGVSAMTSVFFQISPINTFVLCVVMRVLMGWCVGLLFRVLRRVDHKKSWSYFVGAMSAPLLNTIFFMGYIVLVFYKTDYIQERVASLGAANPLMFVVLLVGVQGLIEIIVGCAVGGVLARQFLSFFTEKLPFCVPGKPFRAQRISVPPNVRQNRKGSQRCFHAPRGIVIAEVKKCKKITQNARRSPCSCCLR